MDYSNNLFFDITEWFLNNIKDYEILNYLD